MATHNATAHATRSTTPTVTDRRYLNRNTPCNDPRPPDPDPDPDLTYEPASSIDRGSCAGTELTPAIRTPQTGVSWVDYENYRKTPLWRSQRNAALRRAFWQCEECGARRALEVHHKTYERLGHERSTDLEVLCRDCHQGEHVRQMHDDPSGRVYLKLARDVIRDRVFDSISDLTEEMKTRCARLSLPYDAHQADKALGLLSGDTKFSSPKPSTLAEAQSERGRALAIPEAREIFRRLVEAADASVRTMPSARGENPAAIDLYGPIPGQNNFGDHDRY